MLMNHSHVNKRAALIDSFSTIWLVEIKNSHFKSQQCHIYCYSNTYDMSFSLAVISVHAKPQDHDFLETVPFVSENGNYCFVHFQESDLQPP